MKVIKRRTRIPYELQGNVEDRGAVMIWFALATVALVGMGSLVVDVGALWSERRQLQNGADAAALAVAYDCVLRNCANSQSLAQDYSNFNSLDSQSNVNTLCGNVQGLTSCSVSPSGVETNQYVYVKTSTRNSSGNEVPFLLAPVLDASEDGATVTADATVVWGSPSRARVSVFVIPTCLVPAGINDPSYSPVTATLELRQNNQTYPVCPGTTLDSAFDFAVPDGGDEGCSLTVELQTIGTEAYALAPAGSSGWIPSCKTFAFNAAQADQTILMPVAKDVVMVNGQRMYKLDGFVSVEVCGYYLGSGNGDFLYGQCNGAPHCIATSPPNNTRRFCGIFRRVAFENANLGPSQPYGTYVIKMVG